MIVISIVSIMMIINWIVLLTSVVPFSWGMFLNPSMAFRRRFFVTFCHVRDSSEGWRALEVERDESESWCRGRESRRRSGSEMKRRSENEMMRRITTKITTIIITAKQIIIIFPLCYLQLLLFVDCIALYGESNPL